MGGCFRAIWNCRDGRDRPTRLPVVHWPHRHLVWDLEWLLLLLVGPCLIPCCYRPRGRVLPNKSQGAVGWEGWDGVQKGRLQVWRGRVKRASGPASTARLEVTGAQRVQTEGAWAWQGRPRQALGWGEPARGGT